MKTMLSVLLDEKLKADLEKYASKYDLSISQVVRMALRKLFGGE